MAEAFTNRIAKDRGLEIYAESAGTEMGKELNQLAVQVMNELGISMEGQCPKQLTQALVHKAEKVITMGCGVDADACPAKFLVTEDWGLDDPAGQPIEAVRAIRDQIKQRVEILLDEMTL